MKTTKYFKGLKARPDRSYIKKEWIRSVIDKPEMELIQADGRIRIWGKITELNGRYLRVVLLEDRKTVHNAFFDRRYRP